LKNIYFQEDFMDKKNYWWSDRAWRIVQTNMREIDMADMDAARYVAELKEFNANTVIINTGGIIANYDTGFPFHSRNPYLTGDSLEKVIAELKKADIRVVSRVDFSKVRKSVYENHPDWAYISPKGSIIDYHGDIHVCFNSDYQQKHAIEIMREIIEKLDSDGIFMNMGGYSVAYDYTNGWQGICQCDNCRRRFYDMFSENLPVVEDPRDPVYKKYIAFQRKTEGEYHANIRAMIGETKPELLFFHTDMLRHEAGTFFDNSKQNYLYKAAELLKIEKYSTPEMVSSVTSVDFIDMLYRFSSVSPHHQELRIAQTLANGGFADFYQVGRLDNHPDKSGYGPLKKLFRYHKEHEDDYHSSLSNADIALVKPGVSFFDMLKKYDIDEYFGWYYLLTQNHYFFDCINSGSLSKVSLEKYKTIILPDVQNLDDETVLRMDEFVKNGGILISTGETSQYDGQFNRRRSLGLTCLGVERLGYVGRGIISSYFQVEDKATFPRFKDTDLVYLRGIYCYADYAESVQKYMKLIPPHNHSPAEDAYYTNITDFPAFTINNFDKGKGVFIPWRPGHEYYNFGYPAMSSFMADVLENVLGLRSVGGNLPPMVEVSSTRKNDGSACYIHLVNDSGFFCGSYFDPTELRNLTAEIPWNGKAPSSVVSMIGGTDLKHEIQGSTLKLFFDKLNLFDAVKIVL
jgi:hypothetical protein